MSKQAPVVEWYIAKDEPEWEHLRASLLLDATPAARRHRHLKRSFWRVAALFLLLASAGSGLWHRDQAALPQPAAELRVTTPKELEATVLGDNALTASLTGDPATTNAWRQFGQGNSSLPIPIQPNDPAAHLAIALHTMNVQGDRVVVNIVVMAINGAPAYRQTRFYQRTSTAWMRTEPVARLWGPERSLETPYFVYRFRQTDAQAVIEAAPQVDALYTAMRRNFGLPLPLSAEKLVIEVSVMQAPGDTSPGVHVVPDRLVVASPALYWAPVELADADLLAQSIALPLLNLQIAQASKRYQIDAAWQPLLDGLRLWQVWDLDLPLAAWREEVVKWVYHDLPVAGPEQAVVLPDHYQELCAAYKLWMPSPAQMDIPLLCTELEREDLYFSSWSRRDLQTHLAQFSLLTPKSLVVPPSPVVHPGQTVTLATLVEYTVDTYGRERLPTLVAGLGHYGSWETLIPAVYGVSASKFEAGWQAYLAAHYAVSVP